MALLNTVGAAESCDIAVAAPQAIAPAGFEWVKVVQVADGDTVLLGDGRKVRIIGVNTPELGHHNRPIEPLAEQAKERLTQLLLAGGARKTLPVMALLRVGRDSKDHYGRTLGHVFSASGVNVTSRLLLEGLGFDVAIPVNLWAADCYFFAQQEAKKAKVGVWGQPYYGAKSASDKNLLGGYQRIRGKIEKVFISQQTIWVDLVGHVTLKLDRRDNRSQQGPVLKHILGAHENKTLAALPTLEVQGWLIDRLQWGSKMSQKIKNGERNRWQFNLRHHYQWHFYKSGVTE